MRSDNRIIIGITGGIGAGKSVVSRILRLKGYMVYDCDYEARKLMDGNRNVIAELKRLLTDSIYMEDGRLDRALMSKMLFSDGNIRLSVNRIVHEAVRNDFMEWATRHDDPVFVESAILATSRIDEYCNFIWLVDAPVKTRIDRVISRNGLSEDQILSRIEAQTGEFDMLDGDKVETIDNGGEKSLLDQIDKLLDIQIKYKKHA